MEVKELNEKYQRIWHWYKEYSKEVISYINEAFAMNGNDFALKPARFETWQEAEDSEEFDAMEDLPTYVNIWDRHGFSHEIYITRAYRDSDGGTIYVDGYDFTDGAFVEGWHINDNTSDLVSIAEFINAVFEQEAE